MLFIYTLLFWNVVVFFVLNISVPILGKWTGFRLGLCYVCCPNSTYSKYRNSHQTCSMKRLFWELSKLRAKQIPWNLCVEIFIKKEYSRTNVFMWVLLSFLERLFTEHVPRAPIYGSSSAYNVGSFLDLTFCR